MNFAVLFKTSRLAVLTLAFVSGVCAFGLLTEAKDKPPRAEDVVEKAILSYGGRGAVYDIQRNGTIKTNLKLLSGEVVREGRTTVKFIRKKTIAEDLMMLELELPEMKYVLGHDGQKIWAQHNGETVEPDEATTRSFRAAHSHSYETLLRYKENNAKLEYVGSEKIGPLELDIIDVVLPENERTRFFISRRSYHILALEYESQAKPDAAPVKYRFSFSDFRVIQNTLIPYQIIVSENGKKIEERKVIEVAFGIQLEESAFKLGGAQNKAAENTIKPPGF